MQFLKNIARFFLKDEIAKLAEDLDLLKNQIDQLKATTIQNRFNDHGSTVNKIRLFNADEPEAPPIEISVSNGENTIWNNENFIQIVDKPAIPEYLNKIEKSQHYELVKGIMSMPKFNNRADKALFQKELDDTIMQIIDDQEALKKKRKQSV